VARRLYSIWFEIEGYPYLFAVKMKHVYVHDIRDIRITVQVYIQARAG